MKTQDRLAQARKARHAVRRKQAQADRRLAHVRRIVKLEQQKAMMDLKKAVDALGPVENANAGE